MRIDDSGGVSPSSSYTANQYTPPPAPSGEHLDDGQVAETAKQVLGVGDRTLWFDDTDARLDHFAQTIAGLDADSRGRLFAEVARQDGGAIGDWLNSGKLNELVADGRISESERAAVVEGMAGAYNGGGLEYTQAQSFLGAITSTAPGNAPEQFQAARGLLDAAGSSPAVQDFRRNFANDAFAQTVRSAEYGGRSQDAAFAVTLLGDGGNPAAIADTFMRFNADGQHAIAASLANASIAYRNSREGLPDQLGNLPDPLQALTGSVEARHPVTDSFGRLIQTRIADGVAGSRIGDVQPMARAIYASVADGAAQQRASDPQAMQNGLTRVADATAAAQAVIGRLPPNATQDQINQAIRDNYATMVAPTFAQYLNLRGDAARELSGAALRNEIGMAMGLQPDHVPQTPEDQRALEAGEWDFFGGQGLDAIRTVESRIADVGGPGARVATLPVTISPEGTGGIVQVPLFRVETASGETRFVDFNPANGESRSYRDFNDWRENNQLPPGQMTFAANGHLTADEQGNARTITENTPGTVDTFWERWGQPVLDGAAIVGGVVLAGAAIVGTGGTALIVGGALAAAYGTYRGGEVIVDRATHGQSVNPLESSEARNAWINVGASVVGFAAAGATLRAASLAGRGASGFDDAARLLSAANTARVGNVAAQYADTAAFVDTGYTLAANWDRMTPQQRLTSLAQMAFWGGATTAAARQSGGLGNLYGVGDLSQSMSQMNQYLRSQVPSGTEIQQVGPNLALRREALPPGDELVPIRLPDGTETHAIVRRAEVPTEGRLTTGLRSEFPEAQRITLDERGRFEGNDNAGPNAPLFKRWVEEGNEIYYDRASDTFIYAARMETSSRPGETQRIEIPYRLDAEGNRRADFSAYSGFNTTIDSTLPRDRGLHFQHANRDLAAALRADPELQSRLGLSDETVAFVTKEPPDRRSPPPYTWHHVDGSGRMMLVDRSIHETFRHFGGFSEWGGG